MKAFYRIKHALTFVLLDLLTLSLPVVCIIDLLGRGDPLVIRLLRALGASI